jgi:hypothetical protein
MFWLKFSFSEKTTKIYLENVKIERRMAQIFVVFSEKLNFTLLVIVKPFLTPFSIKPIFQTILLFLDAQNISTA